MIPRQHGTQQVKKMRAGIKEACECEIPEQLTGADSKTTFSCTAHSQELAKEIFRCAKSNLLGVNRWHRLCGKNSAVFTVTDNHGRRVNGAPQEGYYFRIDIPVIPDADNTGGSDWVVVEKMEEVSSEENDFIGFRVRPAVPPFRNKYETAHFFSERATSTFCVTRKGKKITAGVYGRNETPNLQTKGWWNKIRNFFIGIGAMLGLNKPQWKKLVHGILRDC